MADIITGIHRMPMAAYLADPCPMPSASGGNLHTLLTRSPLHAKIEHPKLSPAFNADEDTRFDIGTVAHSMLLEGDDKVAVVEADDWRTKHAQTLRLEARQNGLVPLLRKHYEAVRKMVSVARSFMLECEIAPYLKEADAELTMIWKEGDFWMRARPDLWSKDRKVMVNYKTCECAAPEVFIRRMGGMGYDLSSAFYERGAAALKHRAQEFFIAQETTPPYACSLVGFEPAMREVAKSKLEQAISIWKKCLREDRWPAYPLTVCYASPSSWELDQHEERMLATAETEPA